MKMVSIVNDNERCRSVSLEQIRLVIFDIVTDWLKFINFRTLESQNHSLQVNITARHICRNKYVHNSEGAVGGSIALAVFIEPASWHPGSL
jgi:hypothetical protein